ncbi:MAG: formamidopyrimidine-DNA glycosylase [Candidatus Harrisonbacteria bacterium CG10_big_fil_rev_8_21_14_0_10_40_38]|uniref:Formamidopyrimidine-DNA glycosylase n=1 Tax=Candidatus Harrisonbacteria bacterium CG10_big_fil_rev_8_21_14_0_10_40_38 TaxID=1974583 RepID=A0A2H0UUA4_9BACT|nr:MAG: formamidopyrimidine-DNA glycosylase [Candidatus Harrisonbacteria bacterium CG10_big_fil_rev_8_21_14_0_10_40_38]
MPELPEVQTMVSDLNKKILNRKITGFWSDTPRIFRYTTIEKISKEIPEFKITEITRRAKYILIHLKRKKENKLLAIHPKLTGHLLIKNAKEKENPKSYIRAKFFLDKNLVLSFSDLRKFGKIMFGNKEEIENLPDLKNLGPEPIGLNPKIFTQIISKKKKAIKQVLLDPETISGIGNIYSDEALWMSKIHPFRAANTLTNTEFKKLHKSIKEVLIKSIALRGSSIRNYRDTEGKEGGYKAVRKVYSREGLPCYRCKTPITRVKMGVRSARFCPTCQKI